MYCWGDEVTCLRNMNRETGDEWSKLTVKWIDEDSYLPRRCFWYYDHSYCPYSRISIMEQPHEFSRLCLTLCKWMYGVDVFVTWCSNFLLSASTIVWDTHVNLLTSFCFASEETSSDIFQQYMAKRFLANEAVQCACLYTCASCEQIQCDCADTGVRGVKGPIHSKLNCAV
jgi:hypothetical protein